MTSNDLIHTAVAGFRDELDTAHAAASALAAARQAFLRARLDAIRLAADIADTESVASTEALARAVTAYGREIEGVLSEVRRCSSEISEQLIAGVASAPRPAGEADGEARAISRALDEARRRLASVPKAEPEALSAIKAGYLSDGLFRYFDRRLNPKRKGLRPFLKLDRYLAGKAGYFEAAAALAEVKTYPVAFAAYVEGIGETVAALEKRLHALKTRRKAAVDGEAAHGRAAAAAVRQAAKTAAKAWSLAASAVSPREQTFAALMEQVTLASAREMAGAAVRAIYRDEEAAPTNDGDQTARIADMEEKSLAVDARNAFVRDALARLEAAA